MPADTRTAIFPAGPKGHLSGFLTIWISNRLLCQKGFNDPVFYGKFGLKPVDLHH